jgi:hypothetical protein
MNDTERRRDDLRRKVRARRTTLSTRLFADFDECTHALTGGVVLHTTPLCAAQVAGLAAMGARHAEARADVRCVAVWRARRPAAAAR